MSGLRLRHATMRSGMGLIQDPRPLEPYFCPRCAQTNPRMATHTFKTHHLTIDSEGYCIVSQRVWERMQQMPDAGGFTFINIASDPPPQGIRQGTFTLDGNPTDPRIAGAVLIEGEF